MKRVVEYQVVESLRNNPGQDVPPAKPGLNDSSTPRLYDSAHMADLTAADVKNILHEVLDEKLEPFTKTVTEHHITLFGVSGSNGLNGDVKNAQETLSKHDKQLAWIKGVGAAVTFIIGLVISILEILHHT